MTNLVDINLGIRILLGSSYYEDWQNEETFVDRDPLGNPVDKRHPWNQTTLPKPQKRDLEGGNYSWVMSPRWYDKRTGDYLALDTGGGALARLWATALANKVHTPYVNATGPSVTIDLPRTPHTPGGRSSGSPAVVERDRARPRADLLRRLRGRHGAALPRPGLNEVREGNTKVFEDFDVPDEAIGCGFHEAVRGVLSHHLVIRDGKIANYHPYPPTPVNGSPTTPTAPGPVRGRGHRAPDLRRELAGRIPRIDIMRAVRSFDPCLPCGVHMYLGKGKTLKRCTRRCSAPSREFGAGDGRLEARRAVARIEALLERDGGLRRPRGARGGEHSWRRSSTCTARRSRGSCRFPPRRPWPRTSCSAICCCSTSCIRTRSRPRPAGARGGAAVPRLARR